MPDAHNGPDKLEMSRVDEDGSAVLVLRGEFDLHASPTVDDRLAQIESEGRERLVLDVGGVTFIDSTAMRVVLDAHRRATERGRVLVLRNLEGHPRRMIELTGLHLTLNLEHGPATQ